MFVCLVQWEDISWLLEWRFSLTVEDESQLVEAGRMEHAGLGARLAARLPGPAAANTTVRSSRKELATNITATGSKAVSATNPWTGLLLLAVTAGPLPGQRGGLPVRPAARPPPPAPHCGRRPAAVLRAVPALPAGGG